MRNRFYPKIIIRTILILFGLIAGGAKLFLAVIYDEVLNKADVIGASELCKAGIGSVAVIAVIGGMNWLLKVFSEKSRQKLIAKNQKAIIRELEDVQYIHIEKMKSGEYLTLLTDDTEKCASYFFHVVQPFMEGIILFIFASFIGIKLSYQLTIVILLCSFFSMMIPKYFTGKIEKSYGEKQENKEELLERLVQPLHFVQLIKAYQFEKECSRNFEKTYTDYAAKAEKEAEYSAAMFGVSIGSGFTISTIWMIVGIYFILIGGMNVGAFAAFMMLSDYFNWPFFSLSEIILQKAEADVSRRRIEAFLSLDKDELKAEESDKADEIVVENLSFSYEKNAVLNNIDFMIKGAERTAIIGKSGEGKTTLCKLLLGIYTPSCGRVSIVRNHKRYERGMLRQIVGYMPQNDVIYNGTVEENIRMGNMEAVNEDVARVARISCVDEFVKNLPEGYATMIGKNSKCQLSGGQKARILLARILLRNVPVYILDEFSAALDEENEKQILEHLKEVNAQFIFIAHKENVIASCSVVIDLAKMNRNV